MYVAMTRAEKHCYITHVKSRFRYGRAEFMNPSMFLREISSKYVSMQNQSMGESSRGSRWGSDNYESNTPYRGAHGWDSDTPHYGRGIQNNRPVADRFVADPKPKITRGNRSEEAVDLFIAHGNIRYKKSRHIFKVLTEGRNIVSELIKLSDSIMD